MTAYVNVKLRVILKNGFPTASRVKQVCHIEGPESGIFPCYFLGQIEEK